MGDPKLNEDIDSLISQLGIDVPKQTATAPTSAPAPSAAPSSSVGGDFPVANEVDALLSKLGIAAGMSPQPSSGPGRGMSSGPGAARGVSSGPGAARGMSSGPGRGGMSSGPGAISSGPGRASSGPGAASAPGVSLGPGVAPIKPAQYTPDGQKLTFSGPPCSVCGQEIIGKVLAAVDKQFHPKCFKCEHCQRVILETEPFMDQDGKIYCQEDFFDLFGVRCHGCKQPVTDECIKFGERTYHPNHFICAECGVSLLTREFKEDEGEPYCTKCKAIRVKIRATKNELCAKCKKPILGEYIILNGQKIHPEHYRCEACGCEFLGGNSKEHDGKNYCLDCYDKVVKSVCAGCNKPIVGRSITALLRMWHPECLQCSVCSETFATGKYHEHDMKAYCSFHYFKLFGKICPRCQRTVEGESIVCVGQTWHPECFTCNGCNKPLKDSVYDYESKPLCKSCFSKLPKPIRKAIEEKMEAEKKMKAQKEKKEKEEAKAKTKAAKEASKEAAKK